MKKFTGISLFVLVSALFSACTTTMGATVLVLGFRDLIYYVGLAFIFAAIIGVKSDAGKGVRAFWLWFILGLLLTPLAGFIYLLVLFTKKRKE